MVFLSVLLGVGVDYFIDYLFLPARRNKPMFGPFDNWWGFMAHCWSGILKPPPLPCPIALWGVAKRYRGLLLEK